MYQVPIYSYDQGDRHYSTLVESQSLVSNSTGKVCLEQKYRMVRSLCTFCVPMDSNDQGDRHYSGLVESQSLVSKSTGKVCLEQKYRMVKNNSIVPYTLSKLDFEEDLHRRGVQGKLCPRTILGRKGLPFQTKKLHEDLLHEDPKRTGRNQQFTRNSPKFT